MSKFNKKVVKQARNPASGDGIPEKSKGTVLTVSREPQEERQAPLKMPRKSKKESAARPPERPAHLLQNLVSSRAGIAEKRKVNRRMKQHLPFYIQNLKIHSKQSFQIYVEGKNVIPSETNKIENRLCNYGFNYWKPTVFHEMFHKTAIPEQNRTTKKRRKPQNVVIEEHVKQHILGFCAIETSRF